MSKIPPPLSSLTAWFYPVPEEPDTRSSTAPEVRISGHPTRLASQDRIIESGATKAGKTVPQEPSTCAGDELTGEGYAKAQGREVVLRNHRLLGIRRKKHVSAQTAIQASKQLARTRRGGTRGHFS